MISPPDYRTVCIQRLFIMIIMVRLLKKPLNTHVSAAHRLAYGARLAHENLRYPGLQRTQSSAGLHRQAVQAKNTMVTKVKITKEEYARKKWFKRSDKLKKNLSVDRIGVFRMSQKVSGEQNSNFLS
jgi:hypothetical protein